MAVDFTSPHDFSAQNSKLEAPRYKVTRMPGIPLDNKGPDTETGLDTPVYGGKTGTMVGDPDMEFDKNNWSSCAKLPFNNKLRKHVLISTNSSFAEVAIPLLLEISDIELRVISDGVVDHAQCTCPIDAGTLGAMIAGLTTNLTLTVMRGWDINKAVLLVPGMAISEWQSPVTKRQLNDLATYWSWVKVLPPALSQFEPPAGLVEIPWDSWATFISEIRNCLGCSSPSSTGHEDYMLIKDVSSGNGSTSLAISTSSVHEREQPVSKEKDQNGANEDQAIVIRKENPILPPELLTMIFEKLDDWETAASVGVYAKIPVPERWKPYIPTPGTPATFEYTVLRGSMKEIEQHLATIPPHNPLSRIVTDLILKFSRTDILDSLCKLRMDLYLSTPQLKNLPLSASSKFGSTSLLSWWQHSPSLPTLPIKAYLPEAIDAASRAGFVHVLEWWRRSGLPFRYTERALESASAEGKIAVLDWWKNASKNAAPDDPLPLKVGKSVLLAAQSGCTDSLAWWDRSDIPFSHAESVTRIASNHGHVPVLDFWYRRKREKLIFDNQVLVGATKNGHVEVLEWWKRSGLPVEFKTCDIEEALEDAVSGVEQRVRRWWARNGLNLGVGTNEWMMVKTLNT
ncbi:hypothetical protein ACJ72_04971 [Emergomyces africanus]|uniref:Uncharacterized protein n=1 Tax=Emergomyces africanus TaxID=1955775 RepID=A0A1B7NV87_9EURO|nr:hypothetical protein ACJ72_04971 [Emergomyces africanus]